MLQLVLSKKFIPPDSNVQHVIKHDGEHVNEERRDSTVEEKESPMVWTGTASHNFIEINPNHYSQFELSTYFQGWREISIIQVSLV